MEVHTRNLSCVEHARVRISTNGCQLTSELNDLFLELRGQIEKRTAGRRMIGAATM